MFISICYIVNQQSQLIKFFAFWVLILSLPPMSTFLKHSFNSSQLVLRADNYSRISPDGDWLIYCFGDLRSSRKDPAVGLCSMVPFPRGNTMKRYFHFQPNVPVHILILFWFWTHGKYFGGNFDFSTSDRRSKIFTGNEQEREYARDQDEDGKEIGHFHYLIWLFGRLFFWAVSPRKGLNGTSFDERGARSETSHSTKVASSNPNPKQPDWDTKLGMSCWEIYKAIKIAYT